MSQVQVSAWAEMGPPSLINASVDAAEAFKASGNEVFDFCGGELHPTVVVPLSLKNAITHYIQHDFNHYVSPAGDPELLQALANDFRSNFGLDYSPKQITILAGGRDALFKATMAVLNPKAKRNKAIAFALVYEAFTALPPILTGINTIILQTNSNFYPIVEEVENLLDGDDTIGLIYLNTPNNPSGAVYPEELIKGLARVIGKYPDIAVISDEMYRTIIYDGAKHVNIAKFLPTQTLVVGGASKEVAAAGLRLGYVAGPENLIQAIVKLQGNTSTCVNLSLQKGYAQFLREDAELVERLKIRDELQKRRDLALSLFAKFKSLELFRFHVPKAACYFFLNAENFYGKKTKDGKVIGNDLDVAHFLLHEGNVAVLPGSHFSKPGYVRLAYCRNFEMIEKGFQALAAVVEKLQ